MQNSLLKYLKSHSGTIFAVSFYGLLAIFLFLYIDRLDFSQIEAININWYYILAATVFGIFTRYFSAYTWVAILRKLGTANISYSVELINVYAKAWLGRYIPGKAPWILGKIYFASKHGISKNKLAVSSLLEGGLQIAVTFAIAFSILVVDTRTDFIDPWIRLALFGVLVACIISITPAVFNRVLAFIYKVLRKKEFDTSHHIDGATIFTGVKLYTIASAAGGISLFLVAKAVYPEIAWQDFLYIFGVSNLANAFSMLAIFAPSGIGVKEGIQVLLLSAIMPVEIALSIAVISRIWSIAVDFIFYGSAASNKAYRRKSS